MLIISMSWISALAQTGPTLMPQFFTPVALLLLGGGAVGWLIAAVLGFARARALGASTRWFALASVCLLLYHLQWVALVIIIGANGLKVTRDALIMLAFFNLFVAAASVCAIIGFVRLTATPRA
jgi:hypothetical protein